MLGAWTYGQVYGMNVAGDRYGLYVAGKQYTNDIIAQLSDNGDNERIATYVPTGTSVDIIAKGSAKLQNGKAFINFDKNFSQLVSDKEPIVITVTPTGKTQGVYVQEVKGNKGFVVVENNNGKSSTTINWIAIGTRKGYEEVENPAEVLSADFDKNMTDVYTTPVGRKTNYIEKSFYWDGNKLKFKTTEKKDISIDKDLPYR
jgi:hypothetical protein